MSHSFFASLIDPASISEVARLSPELAALPSRRVARSDVHPAHVDETLRCWGRQHDEEAEDDPGPRQKRREAA
jgi:hypothetical protein